MLAYNIKSVPKDMTLEEVLEIYYTTKVIVYEGPKPFILDRENLDEDIAIINPGKNEDVF